MRNGIFLAMVLVAGGVGYAASRSFSAHTGGGSGSCCGMDMSNEKADMTSGTGCTMGGMKPTAAAPAK